MVAALTFAVVNVPQAMGHALLATVTSRRFLTTIASRRVGIMLSYFWQGIFNAESADAT